MTEKTILVIDMDQETEEEIVSTLEAEDYLVFAASGREITSGTAVKISPILIFLRPTANSVEGFETCKAIHNNEAFKDVPIIVIASLKGPLDARYTSFYGIVDYLEIPVSSGDIIEKTERALGSKSLDSKGPEVEDIIPIEEESAFLVETSEDFDKDSAAQEFSEEDGQPGEDYSVIDGEDNVKEDLAGMGRRRSPKKSGLMVPVILVAGLIAVGAGGFLSYKFFFSQNEPHVPVKVTQSKAVQQKAPPLPPAMVEQPKEKPVSEVKPVETKETLQKAPAVVPPAKPAVVPVAKPAVEPPAKSAVELFYSVQLGAFNSQVSAEALTKTYKNKGYEAFTHKGNAKDNKTLYRVLIGKFKNRKEALSLASELHTKDKIKTTIFSEGRN